MSPTPSSNVHVVERAAAIFAQLGIDHALGGSWASSVHGQPRFTQDADFTVEPFPGKEAALASAFGKEFYASVPAMTDAVQNRSSFNVIHNALGFKIDIFVRKDRPFDQSALRRARPLPLSSAAAQLVPLVTPEDIILFKLEWYRLGGEISGRQWADVLEVVRVQGDRIDQNYLDEWAVELKVADLLHRVRQEATA